MKKKLAKLYAGYQASLDNIEVLEELICECYGIEPEVFNDKYNEIVNYINENFNYKSDLEFRKLIYNEYLKLFNELE